MRTSSDIGQQILFFSFTYDFLERYLPLQVRRSKDTIESYRDALTIFRRFVQEQYDLTVKTMTFGDCSRDLLLSFIEELHKRGCSAGTCNQRLAAIKAYLWFASEKDIAIQSIALVASRIPPVKGPQKIKEKLSKEALSAILSQPDPSKRIGMRDRAIMILLYDSGIRLSELTGLRIGDAVLDGSSRIYVTGKGSKERMVAITDATAAHLKAYIKAFHGEKPHPENPLFFTVSNGSKRQMSSSNIQRLIQKYADEARKRCLSIPPKVHPHMFRRTRATDLYQNGVALELVSRILGHSSVNTTKVYAKPSMAMMRAAMNCAFPEEAEEVPTWIGNEEELIKLCGLR